MQYYSFIANMQSRIRDSLQDIQQLEQEVKFRGYIFHLKENKGGKFLVKVLFKPLIFY